MTRKFCAHFGLSATHYLSYPNANCAYESVGIIKGKLSWKNAGAWTSNTQRTAAQSQTVFAWSNWLKSTISYKKLKTSRASKTSLLRFSGAPPLLESYCVDSKSIVRRQSVLSLAFLHVRWIPMLADCSSALIPPLVRWYVDVLEVFSNEMVVAATL